MKYSEILKKEAFNFVQKIKKSFGKEIIGISISGSISYGSADEFSDIDLDVWLSEEVYEKWINKCPLVDYLREYNPNQETPTNISFIVKGSYKFDVALLSVERIKKEECKIEQKANRQNSVILLDTDNIIKNLLNEKLKEDKKDFEDKESYSVTDKNSESYYHFYISAYLNYHVPVALTRKRFEQAHLNLNWVINLLIELLWIKNGLFFPYMKSRWAIVEEVLNENQKNLLKDAQVIKEYDEEDVKRRRKLLRELYSDLGYQEIRFYHDKVDLT